jgi:hypothetical protein
MTTVSTVYRLSPGHGPSRAGCRAPLIAIAALSAALTATMTGCSGPPPPPSAGAPPPAPVPVPIDGTYDGQMQLSRGETIDCGNQDLITLQVKNQSFTFRLDQPQAVWKPTVTFTATIGPDGSFNAQSGPDSMSGRVAGGAMQGQIIGDICGFSFVANREGT